VGGVSLFAFDFWVFLILGVGVCVWGCVCGGQSHSLFISPHLGINDRGGFWAQSVEILVFASPTGGYMLTSSSFSLLNWGIFYIFLYND
jgi:hypothetical protein